MSRADILNKLGQSQSVAVRWQEQLSALKSAAQRHQHLHALDPQALRQAFCTAFSRPAQGIFVQNIASWQDLPAAIHAYRQTSNAESDKRLYLPLQDPRLAQLNWGELECIDSAQTRNSALDANFALSIASYGIAETAALAMPTTAQQPLVSSFIAQHHLVALESVRILAYPEQLWALIAHDMPRALSLIAGTSGTADIEGQTIRGAHGPAFLQLFIIGF